MARAINGQGLDSCELIIADAASQVQKHPGIPSSGAYVGRVRAGSAAEGFARAPSYM